MLDFVKQIIKHKVLINLHKLARCIYRVYFFYRNLGFNGFVKAVIRKLHDIYKYQNFHSTSSLAVKVYDANVKPFNSMRKSILVITHDLSLSGAPIVLIHAVKEMLRDGYNVAIASSLDGPLREEYENMGVAIVIDEKLSLGRFTPVDKSFSKDKWYFDLWIEKFDLIFLCTIVTHALVFRWQSHNIPIFWWLHEGSYYINKCRNGIVFKHVPEHVHVYCGGIYVQEMLHRYGYQYNEKILLYGVDDHIKANSSGNNIKSCDIVKFVIVGTIDNRKAQDLMLRVIEKMDFNILNRTKFIFVGSKSFGNVYDELVDKSSKYKNIKILPSVSRKKLEEIYMEADCLICPSRDDPMPVVVTEMMMLCKAVICSTNVGQSRYITDGFDGYIFENDNEEELLAKIIHIVEHKDELVSIGNEARKIYEKILDRKSVV